jgi:hypothetical protein
MYFERFGEDPDSGQLGHYDEELVARTLRDIDERSASDQDVMLSALLCAAWPTPRCQRQ